MTTFACSPRRLEELLVHRAWIRRLAGALTSDRAEAEDIAQETWVTLSREAPTQVTRPWLATVVRHLVLRRRSSERRRARREVAYQDPRPAVPSPEHLVENLETERRLARLVLDLREPYRQTVLLRYFEGHPASAIAGMLEVPAGTVRWRLKVALDELRQKLDEEHGGRRDRWVRALLPLSVPAATDVRSPPAGVEGWSLRGHMLTVAAVAVAGILPLLATSRYGAASDVKPGASEVGGQLASFSMGKEVPKLAAPGSAVPAELGQCRDALRRAEEEVASLDALRIRRGPGQLLFAEGAPNPRATVELEPLVRRIVIGDEIAFPPFTLECRTWVCRVQVHVDDPGPPQKRKTHRHFATAFLDIATKARREGGLTGPLPPGFPPGEARMIRFQTDARLRARAPGFSFPAPVPTADSLTGRPLLQMNYYLHLADPSGRPIPPGQRVSHPLAAAQPDPENHQACARRLHAARLRLPELRARVEGRISPLARYERDAPNPALTQELTAALRQMITRSPSEPAPAFEVSCRGQHCRISVPSGTSHLMDLVRRIRKEEPLPTRMDRRATSNGAVTYFVSPTPRTRGLDFLRARLQEFRASGHPDSCYRQHGMSGSLRVRVVLPTTGGLNDDAEKDKISTRYGGDLAATSLGHCIREALDATLAALSLPDPVQGVAWDEVFEFPRP